MLPFHSHILSTPSCAEESSHRYISVSFILKRVYAILSVLVTLPHFRSTPFPRRFNYFSSLDHFLPFPLASAINTPRIIYRSAVNSREQFWMSSRFFIFVSSFKGRGKGGGELLLWRWHRNSSAWLHELPGKRASPYAVSYELHAEQSAVELPQWWCRSYLPSLWVLQESSSIF